MIGLSQVYALGLTRWEVEAEIRGGRWHRRGRQTLSVGDGDPQLARWWHAVLEVGGGAVLDGVSALLAAGLRTITEDAVHVAVPRGARPRHVRGVVVHETRRLEEATVLRSGLPRTRPATAAVHAVLWARSDRQATLYVLAAAQQKLFTPQQFADEAVKVRRDRRRTLLRLLYRDIAGGIEALGEQDFARLCAGRRFPKPARQRVRQGPNGAWRIDNDFDPYDLTVEIDGVQHLDVAEWMADALKQNVVTLEGRRVLRIPNLALRLAPDPWLDQIDMALRAGGWPGPSPARRAG